MAMKFTAQDETLLHGALITAADLWWSAARDEATALSDHAMGSRDRFGEGTGRRAVAGVGAGAPRGPRRTRLPGSRGSADQGYVGGGRRRAVRNPCNS